MSNSSVVFKLLPSIVVEISFTGDDYRAQEPDLLMPVIVTKSSLIASNITLTVSPLTILEAETIGLNPPNVPPEFDDPVLQLENSRARSKLTHPRGGNNYIVCVCVRALHS